MAVTMHQAGICRGILLALIVLGATGADWRQFRGTDNRSVSDDKGLPTACGPETLAWKAPLPGRGPAGPIVVAGRVFVAASSGGGQDCLRLLCLDAQSGKQLWQRQMWATGSTVHNSFGAVADCTPASDGRLVVALWSSNDLACFDLEGNLKWFRGLGYESPTTRNDVGMASSPLIVQDTVVVQLENYGASFATGIDLQTGQTRWRQAREQASNWTSPTVLRGPTPAEDLVLLQSRSRLSVHDPRSGRELAARDHFCHTIASSTTVGDRIYRPNDGIEALRWDAATRQLVTLWDESRLKSGNPCPVVHNGRIYVTKSAGIVVCASAEDGNTLWQVRLKGPFWATPVIAGAHLYAVNHAGLMQVVQLGEEGKLVWSGELEPGVLASPAVSDGAIYFRTDGHVWKFANKR